MKLYTSEIIRKSHFVLYTLDDEIVKYYENYEELRKDINYRVNDLACKFNKNRSDKVCIVANKILYRLYIFK